MCLPLSGYAKRAGQSLEVIQFPNLDRHEEIWKRKVEIAAKAGEQWAIVEHLGEMVSWEYPLHLGAFRQGAGKPIKLNDGDMIVFADLLAINGGVILESGLKQIRLPDWWDSDYATELYAHIDHICHDAETLYEWMRKNEVKPTDEYWACIQHTGPEAFSMTELRRVPTFDPRLDHIVAPNGDFVEVAADRLGEIEVYYAARRVLNRRVAEQFNSSWYILWEDPANRIPAWRTEEREMSRDGQKDQG